MSSTSDISTLWLLSTGDLMHLATSSGAFSVLADFRGRLYSLDLNEVYAAGSSAAGSRVRAVVVPPSV